MPRARTERTIEQFSIGDLVMLNSRCGVSVIDGAHGTVVARDRRSNTLVVELDVEVDALFAMNLPDFEFSRRVRVRPAMVDAP